MPPPLPTSFLTRQLDALVAESLAQAGIAGPPVDAFRLARGLGVDVVVDAGQSPRGRLARVAGRPAIFIRPDPRPERLHWAVAHELGETLAHRVPGGPADELEPAEREQLANLLATRLLLPSAWFASDAQREHADLLNLKRRYDTASHELIAWRLLDLPAPSVVTVFDQGRATRRRSNVAPRAPALDCRELNCWHETHRFGRPVDRRCADLRIQVWPIHEPAWRREIARTTVLEPE